MKTILYVEDNEFNRKIVRHLLARTTYRLIEALDGEAGVTTAREADDLVIMDIQLPKLSGLDATRQLPQSRRPQASRSSSSPRSRSRATTRRPWTRAPPRTWPSPTARASCSG